MVWEAQWIFLLIAGLLAVFLAPTLMRRLFIDECIVKGRHNKEAHAPKSHVDVNRERDLLDTLPEEWVREAEEKEQRRWDSDRARTVTGTPYLSSTVPTYINPSALLSVDSQEYARFRNQALATAMINDDTRSKLSELRSDIEDVKAKVKAKLDALDR